MTFKLNKASDWESADAHIEITTLEDLQLLEKLYKKPLLISFTTLTITVVDDYL